eukprot:727288-Rhodomonas_salina.1
MTARGVTPLLTPPRGPTGGANRSLAVQSCVQPSRRLGDGPAQSFLQGARCERETSSVETECNVGLVVVPFCPRLCGGVRAHVTCR